MVTRLLNLIHWLVGHLDAPPEGTRGPVIVDSHDQQLLLALVGTGIPPKLAEALTEIARLHGGPLLPTGTGGPPLELGAAEQLSLEQPDGFTAKREITPHSGPVTD